MDADCWIVALVVSEGDETVSDSSTISVLNVKASVAMISIRSHGVDSQDIKEVAQCLGVSDDRRWSMNADCWIVALVVPGSNETVCHSTTTSVVSVGATFAKNLNFARKLCTRAKYLKGKGIIHRRLRKKFTTTSFPTTKEARVVLSRVPVHLASRARTLSTSWWRKKRSGAFQRGKPI